MKALKLIGLVYVSIICYILYFYFDSNISKTIIEAHYECLMYKEHKLGLCLEKNYSTKYLVKATGLNSSNETKPNEAQIIFLFNL